MMLQSYTFQIMARFNGLFGDLANVARGMLMGGADIIPGVSGGTVALIVGIYQRLITAISHFDLSLLVHIRHQRWRSAASHIDLRFLVTLGAGIFLGIVTLGGLINGLLSDPSTRSFTLAAFFGAILASTVLVARLIQIRSRGEVLKHVCLGLAAVLAAFQLTRITGIQQDPSLIFIFFSGVIGICAMILPGISGAFILLILGVYIHLTNYLHDLKQGQLSGEALITVAVFGTGCAIGLITFSKFLHWLLGNYQSLTMAILCGFMFGALNKIWPFRSADAGKIVLEKHKFTYNRWPDLDDQPLVCLLIGLTAMAMVLILERVTGRLKE